jgi:hypothetical protein
MQFKVNINEQVKVKLTDIGISILKSKRDELNAMIQSVGGKCLGEFELKTDVDGYSTFQIWDLMNTFGEYMVMGFNVPFETDIIIKNGKQV